MLKNTFSALQMNLCSDVGTQPKSGSIKKKASPLQCWRNKRQHTQVERKRVQTGCKKKLFPREDSQALEKVAQAGCANSDFHEVTGHRHKQPGLTWWLTLFWTRGCPHDLPKLFHPELFYGPVTINSVYRLVLSSEFLCKTKPRSWVPPSVGMCMFVFIHIYIHTIHTL